MREDLHLEYLKLVQDARLFIQQKRGCLRSFEKEKNALPSLAHPITAPSQKITQGRRGEKVSSPQVTPTVEPSIAQPPKIQKIPEKKESSQSLWELQPMGQPEEDVSFRNKLASYTQVFEPLISALLVLPEENLGHRLFLENVSRAITRTFAPASVVLYHEALFRDYPCKLFLAPLSLLKKKFPHAIPHQLFKIEGCSLIPLGDLDLYGGDAHYKRALWNTIQLSFQS